jgi:single-stranded-DNA-specific exonuclease
VAAPGDDGAFLGVTQSLSGRRWRSRLTDERAAQALAQRLSVPEIIGRVLAARGVDPDEAATYLAPTLRASLPDPSEFRDMDKAAARLARAITEGESVAVFGDYDVDGATSSALLRRFFAAVGRDLEVYIPDRQREGYGPNTPALLKLGEAGAQVIVTVDCGTAAHEPLAAAAEAGIDVVVVDHHLAEPGLPPAHALVNPNRLDERAGHGQLAAVGVAFLLVVAVNRALRAAGWYGDGRPEPDLLQWLDLVALGTVCDVVSLTGLNRTLVIRGLEAIAGRGNLGLATLADVAGLKERPGTYHLGYILGPRINAGGRVGRADLGVRLLTTGDADEALTIAHRLDALNDERKTIESAVEAAAVAQVEGQGPPAGALVVAAGEGWHPGVIGIVASRLKERYRRPAFVLAQEGEAAKGSGRSIAGVDLGGAVTAARQAGLLINGGGHAMAAGLTVASARIEELADFLAGRVADQVAAAATADSLGLDGALSVGGATPELLEILESAGPYGAGNPEPRFAVPGARIVRADVVGADHVRCILAGGEGGRLKAIAFRSLESPVGQALLNARGGALHVAGHLRADTWRGETGVQLFIDDAADPASARQPRAA